MSQPPSKFVVVKYLSQKIIDSGNGVVSVTLSPAELGAFVCCCIHTLSNYRTWNQRFLVTGLYLFAWVMLA